MHTKIQFFSKPEGLRQIREHFRKALGKETPYLRGLFLCDQNVTSFYQNNYWRYNYACCRCWAFNFERPQLGQTFKLGHVWWQNHDLRLILNLAEKISGQFLASFLKTRFLNFNITPPYLDLLDNSSKRLTYVCSSASNNQFPREKVHIISMVVVPQLKNKKCLFCSTQTAFWKNPWDAGIFDMRCTFSPGISLFNAEL